MTSAVPLPPVLSRSPWIPLCVAAVAFTCTSEVVFRFAWNASTATAQLPGAVAALLTGVASHLWCRREALVDARHGSLDIAHNGLLRAAIACILAGAFTFSTRLATTELYPVPIITMGLGWALFVRLVLADRRRLSWAAAVRAGTLPGVRVSDRALDAPAFFASVSSELTIVSVPTEAFRGEETALARLPRDTKTPGPVQRRRVTPLLLLLPNVALVVLTLAPLPRLGLPEELTPLVAPGVTIARMGPYPFLEAPPALAFFKVSGPGEAYRVVALEQIHRQRGRLVEGRALLLRVSCRETKRPATSSVCARWASDVLTGKELFLYDPYLEGQTLTFDGVEHRPGGTLDAPTRHCFSIHLETAELRTWPAVDGKCPDASPP